MNAVTRLDPGIGAALAAAALFGAGAPFAKQLLAGTGPWLLAAILYLGSGLGLLLVRRLRHAAPVRPSRAEWGWLAAATACGGIVGPVLLMSGLAALPAASASLLLNTEGVLTALLAWFVFRENVDRRIALGMAFIVAGALVLSWPGEFSTLPAGPVLAVLGACLAWAVDNNLTRKVALTDASFIAMVKGLVAGSTNLGIALLLGAQLPTLPTVAAGALREPGVVRRGAAPAGHGAHRRVFFGGAVLRRAARGRRLRRAGERCAARGGRVDGCRCLAAPGRAPRACACA